MCMGSTLSNSLSTFSNNVNRAKISSCRDSSIMVPEDWKFGDHVKFMYVSELFSQILCSLFFSFLSLFLLFLGLGTCSTLVSLILSYRLNLSLFILMNVKSNPIQIVILTITLQRAVLFDFHLILQVFKSGPLFISSKG